MNNKTLALATFALIALSTARADILNTDSEVISLPAVVVEATRLDTPAADLDADLGRTIEEATALAQRTSDRSLNRLRAHLAPGGRHFARRAGLSVRSRA